MKRVAVVLILICIAVCMSSCVYRFCPACGDKTSSLSDCPVCGMRVCDSCADPIYYYEHGDMEEYLRSKGMLVFYDWDEALDTVMSEDINYVLERIEDYGYTVIKDG